MTIKNPNRNLCDVHLGMGLCSYVIRWIFVLVFVVSNSKLNFLSQTETKSYGIRYNFSDVSSDSLRRQNGRVSKGSLLEETIDLHHKKNNPIARTISSRHGFQTVFLGPNKNDGSLSWKSLNHRSLSQGLLQRQYCWSLIFFVFSAMFFTNPSVSDIGQICKYLNEY